MKQAFQDSLMVKVLPGRWFRSKSLGGFVINGNEIWPVVTQRGRQFEADYQWPDGSQWNLRFDESKSPLILKSTSGVVMTRTITDLGLTVVTAEWRSNSEANIASFVLRDTLKLKGKVEEYYLVDGTKIAELRWRWWWQTMYLECERSFEKLLPVLCADVLSHQMVVFPA